MFNENEVAKVSEAMSIVEVGYVKMVVPTKYLTQEVMYVLANLLRYSDEAYGDTRRGYAWVPTASEHPVQITPLNNTLFELALLAGRPDKK